jgi:site-specific recombinase XerD
MAYSQDCPAHPNDLDQLIAEALRYLEKLHYDRRSLRRYRTTWRHFIAFARERGSGECFDPELAKCFVDDIRSRRGSRTAPFRDWRAHVVFEMKVLEQFARDGSIKRRHVGRRPTTIPPAMKSAYADYQQYARERLHLRSSSLVARTTEIALFLNTLRLRKVMSYAEMQPADITAYVTSRSHYTPRTISRAVSDIRQFLRFLLMRRIIRKDLSAVLPKVRVPRDAAIPSVWDDELVTQLLEVVDRSSPRGKRDYAILLLACRLGLRLGDIRTLTLDALQWDAGVIEIGQRKTGAAYRLPLTEEVGEALIDYLKSGRPKSDHREVFLLARSPFGPFARDNHLYYVVKEWRQRAGIQFRSRQRAGMHSLRHTLATQLLKNETPVHVIAEILGHASVSSTLIYAKADVEALRQAALCTEEADHVA